MLFIKKLLSSLYDFYCVFVATPVAGLHIIITVGMVLLLSSSNGFQPMVLVESLVAGGILSPFAAVGLLVANIIVPIPIINWFVGFGVMGSLYFAFAEFMEKVTIGIPEDIMMVIAFLLSLAWLIFNVISATRVEAA